MSFWSALRFMAVVVASLAAASCASPASTTVDRQTSSFSSSDPDGLIVASFKNSTTFGIAYTMIWWPVDPETGEYVGTVADAVVLRGLYGENLAAPLPDGQYTRENMVSRITDPLGTRDYVVIAARPGTYGLYSSQHTHLAVRHRYVGEIPIITIEPGRAGFLGDFVLAYGRGSPAGEGPIVPDGRDLEAARAALKAYGGIRVPLEALELRSRAVE